MRFLVLSRRRHLYANRRFRETASRLGHELRIIDPLACTVALTPRRPRLLYGAGEIEGVDCAIPRIGSALGIYALSIVDHLETMGVPTVNRARAIARARDKLLALQLLTRAGLEVPRTVLVRSPARLDRALAMVGGPPVVLKLLQGAQGIGVILAETRAAVEATLDALWGLGQSVIVQEFVAESAGRDLRALVIGGRVVAAMRREARPGEWRANLHRGGRARSVTLDPASETAAVAAAGVIGLEVAGVDLLEASGGPKVLEVNASPGFEGLEQATGVDVATLILEHAARLAAGGATRGAASGF